MKIWIDLANSPQVLFFRPLIFEMERRGHMVLLTTRDYAQTIALANQYGMSHTPLGSHGGRRWARIFYQTAQRVGALTDWARGQPGIDLAVSHNSNGQAIAAAALRIPFVTLMDYEHQPANHLCFRLARQVIVPDCFPDTRLNQFRATNKNRKYAGIKEQIYLADFQPRPNYLQTVGVKTDKPIVVMRPPAPWAAYHRKFRDALFDEVLETVAAQDVTVIFTPRVESQADTIRARNFKNVSIPQVFDGPQLIYHADAVISGGGTMNREAGVLGTPAFTLFRGKLAAADEWLMERGRLRQIQQVEELPRIALKGGPSKPLQSDIPLVAQVTEMILG